MPRGSRSRGLSPHSLSSAMVWRQMWRFMPRTARAISAISHAHILTTTRVLSAEGLTDKTRILDAASTGGAEIEAMRGVWANCKTMPLNWRGQEVSIDHRSLEMQGEEALSLGDTVKAEELDREPELKLGPAANAIERREQFAAEVEGRDYEPLTQRGARVHAVRQAKAMFVEMRARLELARYARAEAREEGHVSAGLAALRAVAGGKRKSWTRTRPSSGWRTLRGVIWGKMAPAMRLGPTLSATGLSRCSRAASPIRASSSSEGWRRSAKSSVCLSWKGNAHAIEIRAGSCDFYLHRGRLRRLWQLMRQGHDGAR